MSLPSWLKQVRWNEQGLIACIAQHATTGDVLMMAWCNEESIEQTVQTQKATFFSRSRQKIWQKGESSGNTLELVAWALDCDGDTLLMQVIPRGPSCHTGKQTCFHQQDPQDTAKPDSPLRSLISRLDEEILERKLSQPQKSYTKALLEKGLAHIGGKIEEEANELTHALLHESDERVASEAADLMFHMMVALHARGLSVKQLLQVLFEREGTSGLAEKKRRNKEV